MWLYHQRINKSLVSLPLSGVQFFHLAYTEASSVTITYYIGKDVIDALNLGVGGWGPDAIIIIHATTRVTL